MNTENLPPANLTLESEDASANVTSVGVDSSALLGRMIFVWVKDSRVACYSADEIRGRKEEMRAKGWTHTATIDPARWIEHMANGNDDPSDMLDELQFLPNADVEAPPRRTPNQEQG